MTLLIAPPENTGLENKKLLTLGALLALILGLIVLISLFLLKSTRVPDSAHFVELPDPFESAEIEARSAVVFDIARREVIFSKNPDEVRPLASITKILTAVTAKELLPPSATVVVRTEFLNEEGDNGLYGEESWELTDLISFSLMVSSNDGVAAIASAAGAFKNPSNPASLSREKFIEEMNVKAKEIGMNASFFLNETGLDVSSIQGGAMGTAREITLLMAYALKNHPDILSATRYDNFNFTSQDNITHTAKNTNGTVNSIPGLLGSKTGFTDLAGGNLAIVFDAGLNRPIAIAVLGSSYDGRFKDVKTLADKTLEFVNQGK